jgi:hypothetical protein
MVSTLSSTSRLPRSRSFLGLGAVGWSGVTLGQEVAVEYGVERVTVIHVQVAFLAVDVGGHVVNAAGLIAVPPRPQHYPFVQVRHARASPEQRRLLLTVSGQPMTAVHWTWCSARRTRARQTHLLPE